MRPFQQFILEIFRIPPCRSHCFMTHISRKTHTRETDQRYRIVVLKNFVKITETHLSYFNLTEKESTASVFIL